MIKFCLPEDFDHWLFPAQKGSLGIICTLILYFLISAALRTFVPTQWENLYDCMTFPPISLTDNP